MALPVIPLPTGEIEIAGQRVAFHSLTRSQAVTLSAMVNAEGDHTQEGEVLVLSSAMDISKDEAQAWLDSTDPVTANLLLQAIGDISGFRVAETEAV